MTRQSSSSSADAATCPVDGNALEDLRSVIEVSDRGRPFETLAMRGIERGELEAASAPGGSFTIEALANELGNGSVAVRADVTDRDQLVAAAQRVQDERGGADVLINNAGVICSARSSRRGARTIAPWSRQNLLGAITATEVFLDQLKSGDGT